MGGPRSRVCARLNLCSAPNDTSGNLIAHMFGSGGKKKRSILSPCQATINILFFCFLGENFCYLQPHLKLSARFHKPKTTPSGRKACGREKKNNPENCGHFAARTNIVFATNPDDTDNSIETAVDVIVPLFTATV